MVQSSPVTPGNHGAAAPRVRIPPLRCRHNGSHGGPSASAAQEAPRSAAPARPAARRRGLRGWRHGRGRPRRRRARGGPALRAGVGAGRLRRRCTPSSPTTPAERVPVKSFAARYRAAAGTATAVAVRAGEPSRPQDGIVELPVTVETRIFGTITATMRVPVRAGDDRPRIAWARRLTFPGLRDGETLHPADEPAPARRPARARRHAARPGRGAHVVARGRERHRRLAGPDPEGTGGGAARAGSARPTRRSA